ncbi:hypothetical protein OKW39_008540 [Paraburkholderia sp. MM6662-R1]
MNAAISSDRVEPAKLLRLIVLEADGTIVTVFYGLGRG